MDSPTILNYTILIYMIFPFGGSRLQHDLQRDFYCEKKLGMNGLKEIFAKYSRRYKKGLSDKHSNNPQRLHWKYMGEF